MQRENLRTRYFEREDKKTVTVTDIRVERDVRYSNNVLPPKEEKCAILKVRLSNRVIADSRVLVRT